MAKRISKPNIDLEVKKGIAWAVHAFTTCGIIAGFLALVAVLVLARIGWALLKPRRASLAPEGGAAH